MEASYLVGKVKIKMTPLGCSGSKGRGKNIQVFSPKLGGTKKTAGVG